MCVDPTTKIGKLVARRACRFFLMTVAILLPAECGNLCEQNCVVAVKVTSTVKIFPGGTEMRRTVEAWVRIAEELADEDGLPRERELADAGYKALVCAIRHHPAAFSHIPRVAPKVKSVEKWIETAETLAREHGGLPSKSWLNKNGFSGLSDALRRRPDAFAHVKKPRAVIAVPSHVLKASVAA